MGIWDIERDESTAFGQANNCGVQGLRARQPFMLADLLVVL